GAHSHRDPGGGPGAHLRASVRLYALLERVHLCADLHLRRRPEDHHGGRDERSGSGRHLLLGVADGWRRGGIGSDRNHLRDVPRLLRLWSHRWRGEKLKQKPTKLARLSLSIAPLHSGGRAANRPVGCFVRAADRESTPERSISPCQVIASSL